MSLCKRCGVETTRPQTAEGARMLLCVCRNRPFHVATPVGYKTTYGQNPLKVWLGLEVEIADRVGYVTRELERNPRVGVSWHRDHDGTVQPSGEELVFAPMRGDGFVEGVIHVCEACVRAQAEMNETCSVHVHVDARDWSSWQVRNLCALYLKHEKGFYDLVPRSRRGGKTHRHQGYSKMFSTSMRRDMQRLAQIKKRGDITHVLGSMMYDLGAGQEWEIPRRREQKYHCERQRRCTDGVECKDKRYYGLNLHSWFMRGTLEFRHLEGTIDPRDVVCWGMLCGWFCETAAGRRGVKWQEFDKFKTLHDVVSDAPVMVKEWMREREERFKVQTQTLKQQEAGA